MSTSRPRRAALAIACALAVAACSEASAPAPATTSVRRPVAPEEAAADGVLRIGAVLATSGALAADEAPVIDALRAAVRRLNDRGGVHGRPVELLEEDTKSTVLDGARAAAALADAGADVLVVGCDVDIAATASRVARRAGRFAVGPCATDDAFGIDTASNAGFAFAPSASAIADAVARRLVDAGVRSVITVSTLLPYESTGACQRVAARLRELGAVVVAEVELAPDDPPGSLEAELRRAASAGAFVSCVGRGDVAAAAAAMRAARPSLPIVAATGADVLPWAGPPVAGVTFATTALVWPPSAELAPLVAAGAKAGAPLRTFVLLDVLAQVATTAGPTAGTGAYTAAMRTTTFTTPLGALRFDERQRAVGMPIVFARTDGSGGAVAAGAAP